MHVDFMILAREQLPSISRIKMQSVISLSLWYHCISGLDAQFYICRLVTHWKIFETFSFMLTRPFKQELEIKNLQCTFLFTVVFYQNKVSSFWFLHFKWSLTEKKKMFLTFIFWISINNIISLINKSNRHAMYYT